MEGNLLRRDNGVLLAVMRGGSYISAAETLAKDPSWFRSFEHQRSDGTRTYDPKAECKPWRIKCEDWCYVTTFIHTLKLTSPKKV